MYLGKVPTLIAAKAGLILRWNPLGHLCVYVSEICPCPKQRGLPWKMGVMNVWLIMGWCGLRHHVVKVPWVAGEGRINAIKLSKHCCSCTSSTVFCLEGPLPKKSHSWWNGCVQENVAKTIEGWGSYFKWKKSGGLWLLSQVVWNGEGEMIPAFKCNTCVNTGRKKRKLN